MFRNLNFYQKIIDQIIISYCLCKFVKDDKGEIVDWIYLDVNKKFEEYFGVNKKEIVGSSFLEKFPNSEKYWIEIVKLLYSSNKESLKGTKYHFNSKKFYYYNFSKIDLYKEENEDIEDGIFIILLLDETDFVNNVFSLEKAEQRYENLVENQNVLVVRMGMDGKLTLVNEAYCKKFGKKKEEIIGTNFSPEIHPEDMEETKKIMKNLFSYPFRSSMVQRTLTPVGWRWISWEDCVIHDKNGIPQEIQAIGYDVTDLKEKEIELKRSNKDLENFAYVASHDLQEPLRKIISFENLLMENIEKTKGYIDEEGKYFLDKIRNSASRMKSMINDLLDYSRITRSEDPFVECDINELIYEILENELENRVKESNAEINIEKSIPNAFCNPSQIKQMFLNILSNCMKFRDNKRNLIIGIYYEKIEYNNVVLIIEDNGIGFEDKYNEDIFKSFQKLHSRNEYPGSGIGLAICKRIAERHGWEITANGKIGEGTKIIIKYQTTKTDEDLKNEFDKEGGTDSG